MPFDRGPLETKWAMFRAAAVAECAGETHLTGKRIAAALLRTDSVRAFCSRPGIDSAGVLGAMDDPDAPSFDECERRVMSDLAASGIEPGSGEHRAAVQLRPLEPAVRAVFDRIFKQQRGIGLPPLELLRELLRADPRLAGRLAPFGIDAEGA